MNELPTIGMLWVGKELSWLEELCIKSFLDNGHEVALFTYEAEIKNIPSGTRIESASDILPADKIIRHARTGSPAYHADVFRLHMLQQADYIWADTDAYCCKPWIIPTHGHFHGWISDDKPLVNNGVLKLPKNSKTLAKMMEFTSDLYPIPPWFKPEKQDELRALKQSGNGVHVSLLPWGVWGPNAITWFLQETGEIEHSFTGDVLYPLPFANAGFVFRPQKRMDVDKMVGNDTFSIHFWGRRFRNIAARYEGVPTEGSYVDTLLHKHGIDPKKSAHLMINKQAEKMKLEKLGALDFSMFTDADVANIILQRSEIGDTGKEVRSWINGDDTPLLEYAKNNKDYILTEAVDIARRECDFFIGSAAEIHPKRIADIGCGYAFADLFLYQKFKCDIVLIDIESSEDRHFGLQEEGSGYASLVKARKFLEANGVPKKAIKTVNPNKSDVSKIKAVDLAISLASCGFHYPVAAYDTFFKSQINPNGGIVLDIRKGSGGIHKMKPYGNVTVLQKHQKYSTVIARKEA